MLMAALSPVAVVFSFSLMPELLFAALLLASLILAERAGKPEAPRWLALVSGLCAALAYLAKSVAAPLLFTVPLCFALRKQFESRAFLCRDAARRRGVGVVGDAPHGAFLGPGDALLHQLCRL